MSFAETPFERQINVRYPDQVTLGGKAFKKPVKASEKVEKVKSPDGSIYLRIFRCIGFSEQKLLDTRLDVIPHKECDQGRKARVYFSKKLPFHNEKMMLLQTEDKLSLQTEAPFAFMTSKSIQVQKSGVSVDYTNGTYIQLNVDKRVKNSRIMAVVRQVEHLTRFMGGRMGEEDTFTKAYVLPVERGLAVDTFAPLGQHSVLRSQYWMVNPQDDMGDAFFPQDQRLYLEVKVN